MSKKTTPSAQNANTSRSQEGKSRAPARPKPLADQTIQLHIDDLQPHRRYNMEASDGLRTQTLPEEHLRRAAGQDMRAGADTTTDFEIPTDMLEPLDSAGIGPSSEQNAAPSNQVQVYDPFMTREPPAQSDSMKTREQKKPRATIKMSRTRSRPKSAVHIPEPGEKTAARLCPAELRDIDEEGFHVFIARPDAHGRVSLPEELFGERGEPEKSMLLVKAKILRRD